MKGFNITAPLIFVRIAFIFLFKNVRGLCYWRCDGVFRRFIVYKKHQRPLSSRWLWEYYSRIILAYLRELKWSHPWTYSTTGDQSRHFSSMPRCTRSQSTVTIGLWIYFSYGWSSATVMRSARAAVFSSARCFHACLSVWLKCHELRPVHPAFTSKPTNWTEILL